jgi:hypothetical protein
MDPGRLSSRYQRFGDMTTFPRAKPDAVRDLARSHLRLGFVEAMHGDLDETKKNNQVARDAVPPLAKADPQNVMFRADVLSLDFELARLQVLKGCFRDADRPIGRRSRMRAEAEAALAWLNLSFVFEPTSAIAPASVVGPFLDGVDQALTAAGISIVHLKVFCNSAARWIKAAICAHGEEPRIDGQLDASPANRHELLLNLRAKGDPDLVPRIVAGQLLELDGEVINTRLDCFSPAPPKPERRSVPQ